MTSSKYAKKNHYLEVHSRVKVPGKLVSVQKTENLD